MKHFLILLFGVSTFCANSQTVTIPTEAAKWYLEQADLAELLQSQVKTKEELVANLEARIKEQKQIILTYQNDHDYYAGIISVKNDKIALLEDEVDLTKKEVKRQRTQKLIAIYGGTGAIIGGVFGQPLAGAAIGAGVGYLTGILKKK